VVDKIAQELENVGLGLESNDDQAVEDLRPPVKKTKTDGKNQRAKRRVKKKNIGMLLSYILKVTILLGVRRSQRKYYRPLEYWLGEKLIYWENLSLWFYPRVPLGTKRKDVLLVHRSQSKVVEDDILPALPKVDPEEGWDLHVVPLKMDEEDEFVYFQVVAVDASRCEFEDVLLSLVALVPQVA
jgi:hypothetical protein